MTRADQASFGYEYSLGLTSQFYFCALPLRLDTEPRCRFACLYCFSKARGGADLGRSSQVADPERLRRRLERIRAGRVRGAIDAMLERGSAIHFGGMSDAFGTRREVVDATRAMLRILADYGQATVISTKALVDPDDELLADLKRGRFLVQFSFSTLDDALARRLEVGCPSPGARLKAMSQLSSAGVAVTARLQPVLPKGASAPQELVDAVSTAGACHVGVEHLKVPLEQSWGGTRRLSATLGYDVFEWYRRRHAQRVGRELVLRVEDRLPAIVALRDLAHKRGMTFGAADTDLLLLSDGSCCCSGADLHGVADAFHNYTYTQETFSANGHETTEFATMFVSQLRCRY